jgi:hypothetical protein
MSYICTIWHTNAPYIIYSNPTLFMDRSMIFAMRFEVGPMTCGIDDLRYVV